LAFATTCVFPCATSYWQLSILIPCSFLCVLCSVCSLMKRNRKRFEGERHALFSLFQGAMICIKGLFLSFFCSPTINQPSVMFWSFIFPARHHRLLKTKQQNPPSVRTMFYHSTVSGLCPHTWILRYGTHYNLKKLSPSSNLIDETLTLPRTKCTRAKKQQQIIMMLITARRYLREKKFQRQNHSNSGTSMNRCFKIMHILFTST